MVLGRNIKLDIQNVEVVEMWEEKGEYRIRVESTMEGTDCRKCGRKIEKSHGHDREIEVRHLSILGKPVYILMRPRRYKCPHCSKECKKVTTTQRVNWYNPKNSLSRRYEEYLLVNLVNSTIQDVSIKERISYDKVRGVLKKRVTDKVDWSKIENINVLGLDEIAVEKGHKNYLVIVTSRGEDGEITLLGVLKDRKKATVKKFLQSMPAHLQMTVKSVCSDMYDGYINAAYEVFSQGPVVRIEDDVEQISEMIRSEDVSVVVDRFHVAKKYREALEKVRKKEMARLRSELDDEAYKQFKGVHWLLRRKYDDLEKDKQDVLDRLFVLSPAIKQVYDLCQELTDVFDTHHDRSTAKEAIEAWKKRVMKSGIKWFDSFLTTLNNHFDEILNYFDNRLNSGFVEGLNNKIKVIKRRCYGLSDAKHFFQRIFLDLNGYDLFLPASQ